MEVIICKNYEAVSRAAAEAVAAVLNEKPNGVLGMATGSTPLGRYQELVRMHRNEVARLLAGDDIQPRRIRRPAGDA